MNPVQRPLFFLCLGLTVIQADASSWTAEVPSSVKGLLGSCVVIPCSFNYPDPGRKVTAFTGIWTEKTNHIIYHPVEAKMMQQYRNRAALVGDLSKKSCSLKIDPLQSTDTGPFHFRIEMEGYDKFSYLDKEVSITMTSSPEPITMHVNEVPLGETVSASCSASHSCPSNPPVFTWSHSGKPNLQSTRLDSGQWEARSSLTFHPTRADHNKFLECTVTYRGGQSMNSSMVLKVKYAPVNVKVDYKSSVREGEAVQLRCSSEAYPAAHGYQWHDDSGALLYSGPLYTLANVSRHTGALYCTAINTEGQGKSSPVQLNVLYPPEIKAGSSCSSDSAVVTCVCIAESKPPSMIQFFLPDKVLQSTEPDKHSIVTIGILKGDLGSSELVHCRANNSQGNASFTFSVPANSKITSLHIAIVVSVFVIIVIFLTALGVRKKCRGSRDDEPTSNMQDMHAAKTMELPNYSSATSKGMKNCDDGAFSNCYTNDHVYGNMEAEWAADDDAVYANV
ncbi:sialic acid-binding Ig-like lectin 13 [Centroberyx gerrardi]|uniref:sialic acid-binding Ig-like lectin 13 n=1 Tax=Centroberyx gerrardi TaxID=166262 RepID=UPI003AAACC9E